jgi:uncharacterized protein
VFGTVAASITKILLKMNKPFRILSIDGGGIKGIFPAKVLAEIESDLQIRGSKRTSIFEHFDLIAGTSTGGIIALGLALGVPANEILNLYLGNAKTIFGNKKSLFAQIFYSAHKRDALEKIIRDTFKFGGRSDDPRLKDCRTNICIPIYDLVKGAPSVLKTKHHDEYVRDFHIPAYQVALATSAAPTFFDPYSTRYLDLAGNQQVFSNKVDGGVVMNNPTLVAIIEAQKAFNQNLENIRVLSIGTGNRTFCDASTKSTWGLWYWIKQNNRKRLIELFMQGQSQQVENLVSILHRGIGKREPANFIYQRIDTVLDDTCDIELDETKIHKLEKLVEKGHTEFQNNVANLRSRFFDMVS